MTGSANYSQGSANQKPEWKRYKQYSRTDLSNAIQAVRDGMSALQASRKYNVPSRTLYDKVKKMGIVGARPLNRSSIKRSPSNNGSPAAFPYGISGTRSPLGLDAPHSQSMHDSENGVEMEQREPEIYPLASLGLTGLDPSLLLKAIERNSALAAANGMKNMARQVSQSPPSVYQGSSTAAPNSPPVSIHEDEDDDDEQR